MENRITAVLFVVCLATAGRADEPADPLAKAPSRFAKFDSARVHYKSLGEGKTAVVFVHGWACDLSFWRFQVPALAGKTRLVLIDLPGHGQSDKPKADYTMDYFARAIDAVLKDAGVEKAVLAGHSMGTPVARQFYRLYPEKTAGLVAVDGSLRLWTDDREEIKKHVARFEGDGYKEHVERFMGAMFGPAAAPEVKKEAITVVLKTPQHVGASAMKNMFDPAVWKDDPIKVPLQVINAKSPFWAADYEEYVRKLAPHVDYQTIDGVGHFLMLEKPKEFNRVLTDFLKKQGVMKE